MPDSTQDIDAIDTHTAEFNFHTATVVGLFPRYHGIKTVYVLDAVLTL